jgi:hypothetical protein
MIGIAIALKFYYGLGGGSPPPPNSFLQQENLSYLLQEDLSKLIIT